MPQPPSPSMGIIWPTDNDDANQWAPIMDTAVRVVIDGHNHAAGNGAKVNISSLAIDADISFVDAGGGKHAITDLKAIDFFPSPASAMTGFGGAFFVSDGTGGLVNNELYYRTTLGANVQFTSGATMNVGAFAGTIGGDYVGVAALESFVDAADAYLFQQQVGAGIRQFAKLQSADLQLFEFKAVGASPAPTQAVTLKSPAALAAGYALTFPGALPASASPCPLLVDSAGNVTCSAIRTLKVAMPGTSIVSSGSWDASGGALSLTVTIPLHIGDRILAVRCRIKDSAVGPTKITLTVKSSVDGVQTSLGNTLSAGSGAVQSLSVSGLSNTVIAGTDYLATIAVTTGSDTCHAYSLEVDYDRP